MASRNRNFYPPRFGHGGAGSAWIHLKGRHPKKVTKNLSGPWLGAQLDMDRRELPETVKHAALVEGIREYS